MLNEHDLKDFQSEQPKIIRNAIQTPDGTVLDSQNTWDYQTHTDRTTGEFYFTDGGLEYLRRSVNKVPAKDLTVTTADPFWMQREAFRWTSITKDAAGNVIRQARALQQLTDDHINAILRTQWQISGTYVEQLMKQELEYRKALRDSSGTTEVSTKE